MRAAVIVAPNKIELREIEIPEPNANEVRVRLESCSVCASNLEVWAGQPWFEYPLAPGAPGHEGWGIIDALGENATEFAIGDRVAFLSGNAYAECDIADKNQIVKLTAALDGKPFPGEPLGCAMNIFRRSEIKAGQTASRIFRRRLVRELEKRGHDVLFLERDVPWYASNRDLPAPSFGRTELYQSLEELKDRFGSDARKADAVIVGSYVPEGVAIGEWVTREAKGVTAFYDIDTPVTLAKFERGDYEYLAPHLIPQYDIYLSFTGGPTLREIEKRLGSPAARPLYCSADETLYFPEKREPKWDLGYTGTYSDDRQPPLNELLIEPARRAADLRFVVAGSQYPASIYWATNVERIEHLSPAEHRAFYNSQKFTLNITRADMIRAGFSPSVRLFEAAACGVPIVSDFWEGLDTIFEFDKEILVARSADDVLRFLREIGEDKRREIGERARRAFSRNIRRRIAPKNSKFIFGKRRRKIF